MKKRWFKDVESVETKAWSILEEFGRQFTQIGIVPPNMPPVPVQDIARLLAGLDLDAVWDLQHRGQKLSGLLEPDIHLISYDVDDMLARQVFSIAHELGHYYLHYLPVIERRSLPTLFPLEEMEGAEAPVTTYYRCSVEDIDLRQRSNELNSGGVNQEGLLKALRAEQQHARQEAEANWFAAALLMPVPYVEKLVREGYASPHELAARLGVSPLAAEVRLVRMGYRNQLERNRHPDEPTQKRFT